MDAPLEELFDDEDFARLVRARQDEWLEDCSPVMLETVLATSLPRRLFQNALAMVSPLL